MEQKLNLKEIFSREGIILAAVPVVAYYSGYQYNAGYFHVFGAPIDLISVDLTTFVVFGSVLFGISFILYNTISVLWSAIGDLLKRKPWKQFGVALIAVFAVLWFLFWLLYDDWRPASRISAAFLVFFVFCYFAVLYKVAPQWFLTAILCVGLLTSISRGIGHYQAITQKSYTVITDLPNTFVVRKLGDSLLCSTYDPKTHSFSKALRLLPIGERGLGLEYRNIGPLHVAK